MTDNGDYLPPNLFPERRVGNESSTRVYEKENLIGIFLKYYIPVTYICLTEFDFCQYSSKFVFPLDAHKFAKCSDDNNS